LKQECIKEFEVPYIDKINGSIEWINTHPANSPAAIVRSSRCFNAKRLLCEL